MYYELGNQNRILISSYLGRAKLFSVDRIVGSNKCLSWILSVAYFMVANLVKAIISVAVRSEIDAIVLVRSLCLC